MEKKETFKDRCTWKWAAMVLAGMAMILMIRPLPIPAAEDPMGIFQQIATDGFGDRQNSFAWAMKWWNGKLYVGTGRSYFCVTNATADQELDTHFYELTLTNPDVECAPTPQDLDLSAEIWRYTPETGSWERVFKSPNNIPIPGSEGKMVAPDIGFRGMAVFTEPGGTQALYVGGVSSRSINPDVPPPRILRSTDGQHFEAIPQEAGTFLGDLPVQVNGIEAGRSFRSMMVYKGRLYVTCADYRGVGALLESAEPWKGNDAFRQVTPPDMKVWALQEFNGYLYLGLETDDGFAVAKTDATGDPPYQFQMIIDNGAYRPKAKSKMALSFQPFNGYLYVGTDRPTELYRIAPDDSWDLVVGETRTLPNGQTLEPLSGETTGFGNFFNGHFWRMAAHQGFLVLGTWDWSVNLRNIPGLGNLLSPQFGFDIYMTADGVHWFPYTTNGFGDEFNYGVRTLESTPAGLFIGTANPFYGLQVWKSIF